MTDPVGGPNAPQKRRVAILTAASLSRNPRAFKEAETVARAGSYSENFGNTVLEAMRRAVPVIVTTEVGTAEMVRASGAGLVVDGAPESLAAAINQLIGNETLARAMGESGRQRALANCSWGAIAAQMEELYGKLRNCQR